MKTGALATEAEIEIIEQVEKVKAVADATKAWQMQPEAVKRRQEEVEKRVRRKSMVDKVMETVADPVDTTDPMFIWARKHPGLDIPPYVLKNCMIQMMWLLREGPPLEVCNSHNSIKYRYDQEIVGIIIIIF